MIGSFVGLPGGNAEETQERDLKNIQKLIITINWCSFLLKWSVVRRLGWRPCLSVRFYGIFIVALHPMFMYFESGEVMDGRKNCEARNLREFQTQLYGIRISYLILGLECDFVTLEVEYLP